VPAPLQRLIIYVVAGLLAGISFLAISPLTAYAGQADLSTVILSDTLPGMVLSPSGTTNGPLNQANVNLFNAGTSETAAIDQQLSNGNLSGYLRVWTQQPPAGDGAVVLALELKDASLAAPFLGDFNLGVRSSGASSFSVPQISGATGFSDQIAVSGVPATAYAVTFARGDTIFSVELVTESGDLAPSDAIALAARQATAAPGAPSAPVTSSGTRQPHPVRVGPIVGFVVGAGILIGLVILLLVLVRHRKRRFTITTSYPGVFSHEFSPVGFSSSFARPVSYAPPSLAPRPIPSLTLSPGAGWFPEAADPYHQRYWDGQAWTAQMRWNGSSWVDVPAIPPTSPL
jgi:hypothetical protein